MQKVDTGYNQLFLNFLLFIIISISFVISTTSLDQYIPLMVTLTVLIYIFVHFGLKNKLTLHQTHLDIYYTSFVVFSLVFHSGGLYSPLFFLVYFLLFAVALLIAPASTYLMAIVASVLFFTSLAGEPVRELLTIGSLFLIAPLANISGRTYLTMLQGENKIRFLEEESIQIQQELRNEQKNTLGKTKMIKAYTDTLLKKQLALVWEQVDALLSEEKTSPKQKERLNSITKALQNINLGADKIQEENKA